MLTKRTIDHIVYAVPDLDDAMEWFTSRTGISPVFGGHHKKQGTKNALVNLGNACYLELLATDEENQAIAPPRWMGIDLLKEARVTRWALKSERLVKDALVLESHQPELGTVRSGQRKTNTGVLLQWGMTMPRAEPLIEVVPFMTDWSASSHHPTDQLPAACQFLDIEVAHPDPQSIQPVFTELGLNLMVHSSKDISIKVVIETPKGVVELV
ncbi:MAG: VOC family protein [Bacteroidota bacterium]